MQTFAKVLCVFALTLLNCQSVQTPDDGRAWGDAESINNSEAEEALRPDVAVDPNGNAVAVWDDPVAFEGMVDPPEGRREDVWSNSYTSSTNGSWTEPDLIETNDTGPAIFPRIAMDGEGNGVAVWQQKNGSQQEIWSNRYMPGDGWAVADAERIGDNKGNARRPEVAMDPTGNAVAVWYQSDDDQHSNIWSNRYIVGVGWAGPELIESDDAGDAKWPQVAMDPGGNAVAVWQQCIGKCESEQDRRSNIWSNRYIAGEGWGARPRAIDFEATDYATHPHVAIDDDGNAVAVWQQSDDDQKTNIWSNRYTVSVGWGNAELIESENAGDASRPQVAMDPEGNAVAVWSQFDGTSDGIWSNRYAVSREDWSIVSRLDGNDAGGATRPRVAMDASGSAVAVWTQPHRTQPSIWSNRYTTSLGWGAAEPIETYDGGGARQPVVAMDGNGEAVAIWSQRVRANDEIWSNRLEWRDAE